MEMESIAAMERSATFISCRPFFNCHFGDEQLAQCCPALLPLADGCVEIYLRQPGCVFVSFFICFIPHTDLGPAL